jgi:carbamoyltransferase
MQARVALGIHIGHDRGAAVVRDGDLIAQMAEERLDRRKHSESPELPAKAISAVLEIAGISRDQLGVVGISYTNVVIDDILVQLTEEVRDLLRAPSLSVQGVGHHDCHAWSTYFTSDFDKALILVADGAGDIVGERIEAESLYLGEGHNLKLLDKRLQDFGAVRTTRRNSFNLAYMSASDRKKQISLGRKYEQFTYLVGFGHGHAGKTMALASFAEPLFKPEIPRFSGLQFPLSFEDGLTEIDEIWKRSGEAWHQFVRTRAAGIAASGQALVEAYLTRMLQSLDPGKYGGVLCGAGGLFLSCRLNQHILASTGFNNLHVIPAAGDDGQCIGAAFAAYASEFGPPTRSSSSLPYLGRSYDQTQIEERLRFFGLRSKLLGDEEMKVRVAADLAQGRLVGVMRGRSELGPRALCHRSLLADPRRAGIKDCLNGLKGREKFRPFAPVVTADAQDQYFDLRQTSPFMLLAGTVRPEYRTKLPAITHVDGSSRVQAIRPDQDAFIYGLLKAFENLTGFPILVNTSFNIGGDPIVESPHDAITTFINSDVDVLLLENHYVSKRRRVPKGLIKRLV